MEHKSELLDNSFHFAENMMYSGQWPIRIYNSEEYEILNDDHDSKELPGQNNSVSKFLKAYLYGDFLEKPKMKVFGTEYTTTPNNRFKLSLGRSGNSII